jgi:hypothetical protein
LHFAGGQEGVEPFAADAEPSPDALHRAKLARGDAFVNPSARDGKLGGDDGDGEQSGHKRVMKRAHGP